MSLQNPANQDSTATTPSAPSMLDSSGMITTQASFGKNSCPRFWHAGFWHSRFWRYTFIRLLYLLPVLLVASFGVFMLLRLGGGDPVAQYLSLSNLPSTPENLALTRAKFGLDEPLLLQYISWLGRAIWLDFGSSFMSGREVAGEFFSLLPTTLALVGAGLVLVIICSVILGTLGALYQGRIPDMLISLFCFIGVCMPSFWLAFLLVWGFSITLGWLPAVWNGSPASFVLPSIAIALMSACVSARVLRANMIEAASARHVIYAKARLLPKSLITFRHVFANALLPLLAMIGMHVGELLGGALVVESIFAMPGIGLYCIQAINNHDYPVIQCFILVLCVVFTLSNLLVDLICAYLDPRIQP